MDIRYTERIVSIAKSEVGQVGDDNPENGQIRRGWERLKGYFEVAGGYTEAHWKMNGMVKVGGELKTLNNLDGVRLIDKRVPQRNVDKAGNVTWSGTQWCGIFATWCWVKAGVPGVKWGFPGVSGAKVRIVPDEKHPRRKDITLTDVGIGDIVIIKDKDPAKPLVHHCVVTKLDGSSFESVNGNSDKQGIIVKPRPRSDILYFYTYRDDILNVINYLYNK